MLQDGSVDDETFIAIIFYIFTYSWKLGLPFSSTSCVKIPYACLYQRKREYFVINTILQSSKMINLIGYSLLFVLFILYIILDIAGCLISNKPSGFDWHSNLCFGNSIARYVLTIMSSVWRFYLWINLWGLIKTSSDLIGSQMLSLIGLQTCSCTSSAQL